MRFVIVFFISFVTFWVSPAIAQQGVKTVASDQAVPQKERGVVFALMGPSGVGKTTLHTMIAEKKLLQSFPDITTRPARSGEKNGLDHTFVSQAYFDEQKKKGNLIAAIHYYDNNYGILKNDLEKTLERGQNVLLVIVSNQYKELKERFGDQLITIMIVPPSGKALVERIVGRAKDSKQAIQMRLAQANQEMAYWNEMDHVLINQDLKQTFESLVAIIALEKQRLALRERLKSLIPEIGKQVFYK